MDIKYGYGEPVNVDNRYTHYLDLVSNTMYIRNGNTWVVYYPEGDIDD